MIDFWNERYGKPEYAYGEEPNAFFRQELNKLRPGKILLPAEGEGRNAVFAARMGWQVTAFDMSLEGKKKAELLAAKYQVTIDYRVGEFNTHEFVPDEFDAIGLIFAHFPAHLKPVYHAALSIWLRSGGTIILEAFSKDHLTYQAVNPKVGGPPNRDQLFSIAEVQEYFPDFDVQILSQEEVELQEGLYHQGTSSVVRFVGVKN